MYEERGVKNVLDMERKRQDGREELRKQGLRMEEIAHLIALVQL